MVTQESSEAGTRRRASRISMPKIWRFLSKSTVMPSLTSILSYGLPFLKVIYRASACLSYSIFTLTTSRKFTFWRNSDNHASVLLVFIGDSKRSPAAPFPGMFFTIFTILNSIRERDCSNNFGLGHLIPAHAVFGMPGPENYHSLSLSGVARVINRHNFPTRRHSRECGNPGLDPHSRGDEKNGDHVNFRDVTPVNLVRDTGALPLELQGQRQKSNKKELIGRIIRIRVRRICDWGITARKLGVKA